MNECTEHKHDCPSNSACINTADGFTCRCIDGYRDDSPNPERPGRICAKSKLIMKAKKVLFMLKGFIYLKIIYLKILRFFVLKF